jgi:hypothetical protein
VESLRVLRVIRATAIRARRSALQLQRMSTVFAPEELRGQVRTPDFWDRCSRFVTARVGTHSGNKPTMRVTPASNAPVTSSRGSDRGGRIRGQ